MPPDNSYTYVLFCVGVYLIDSVVIVPGEQRGNSTTRRHISILPHPPLPSVLPPNIEQSSLCYLVGPRQLSI